MIPRGKKAEMSDDYGVGDFQTNGAWEGKRKKLMSSVTSPSGDERHRVRLQSKCLLALL